jgi:tRNA(Arg) A34 adenosine deaminase TadA
MAKMTTVKPSVNRRHLLCGAMAGAASLSLPSPAFARGVQTPATAEDESLMRLAIEEAGRGDFPFGAVIVRDGKSLAKGRNLGTRLKDPTAHAEMLAIRRFLAKRGPEQNKDTTLYATGEPCAMCMGAILWCGIPRLVYGASIAELAEKLGQIMVTSQELADKAPFAEIKITGGVLAKDILALFK